MQNDTPVTVNVSPEAVYVSETGTQSSKADLCITVQNKSAAEIHLKSLSIRVPDELVEDGTLATITPVATQDTIWSFGQSVNSENVFTATPCMGSFVTFKPGELFMFNLMEITLSKQTGPCNIKVTLVPDGVDSIERICVVEKKAAAASIHFTSQPAAIVPGQSADLVWDTTGVDYCIIPLLGDGHLPDNGVIPVKPSDTTTYTLNGFGPGFVLKNQWTITVENPHIQSFGAARGQSAFDYGEPLKLVWRCNQFVKRITLTCNDPDMVIPKQLDITGGVDLGTIKQNTKFVLTAYGSSDDVFTSWPADLFVNPPQGTLTITPDHIWQKDEVVVEWATKSAKSVTIAPAIPGAPNPLPLSGKLTIRPENTVEYILTVNGAADKQPAIRHTSVTVKRIFIKDFLLTPEHIIPSIDDKSVRSLNQTTLVWDVDAEVIHIDCIENAPLKGSRLLEKPANGLKIRITAGTRQNPALAERTVTVNNVFGPVRVTVADPPYNYFLDVADGTQCADIPSGTPLPPRNGLFNVEVTGLLLENGAAPPHNLKAMTEYGRVNAFVMVDSYNFWPNSWLRWKLADPAKPATISLTSVDTRRR